MHRFETINLMPASFGTERHLHVHRFGTPGAAPKAYIQASLHADETPAMLVAHQLLERLLEADRRGEIRGEVVVVPFANPIGLSQRMLALHVGRGDLGGGGNFNRGFPNLSETAIGRLKEALGSDRTADDGLVRNVLREAAEALRPNTELDMLKAALLRLAVDAHIVLDLHCHMEGLTYLYCNEAGWPEAQDLSAQIGSRATLVGGGGGSMTFDEACDEPWIRVGEAFGGAVAHGCLAATIEYRGQADVSDELASADADNLFRFLQRRGMIAGEPGPLPEPLCAASPVDAVDHVRAPHAGLIIHKVGLGDEVQEGQVVAEIVRPEEAIGTPRTQLRARTSGVVFGRLFSRLARPGTVYLSIAGQDPSKVRDGMGDPYP